MFLKKYGDYVVSGFFLALSTVMYVLATRLPKSRVMKIGPDFMPKVIAAVMFILSVILLLSTILTRRVRKASVEKEAAEGRIEKTDYRRVILSFLMILLYVFTLKPVGFTIMSLIFLPAEMFILAPDDQRTKKDLLKYLIISVIVVFVVYFLFRYGFKILLPRGIFAIEI